MVAKGEVSLWAMTAKPGGMAVMRSPWLIQTVERWPGARRPSNSGEVWSRRISAQPCSRSVEGSTRPPSWAPHGTRRSRRQAPGRRPRTRPAVRAGSALHGVEAGPPERMIAGRGEVAHEGVADGAGVDFAIEVGVANAAGDKLGVLRAEIEDQDAFGHRFGRGGGVAGS